jgi:hypothetical protein
MKQELKTLDFKRGKDKGKRKPRRDKGRRGLYRNALAAGAGAGVLLGTTLALRARRKKGNNVETPLDGTLDPTLKLRKQKSLDKLKSRRAQLVENSGMSFEELTRATYEARGGNKSAQSKLRERLGKKTRM